MQHSRRRLILGPAVMGFAGISCAPWAAPRVAGEPLTWVVPFAAGGGPDVLTRLLARCLETPLSRPVVVVNRPGAGGLIGAESVARSTPDGRTVLASSVNLVIQAALNPQSRIDPVADFDHISLTGTGYSVVVVSARSPVLNFEQLLDAIGKAPSTASYGSGGIGSLAHFCAAALLNATGLTALHVPYRGSVDVPGALENGDILFSCLVQSTALPLIRQGRLRPLAISAAQPSLLLPGIPTLRERLNSQDAVIEGWSGLSGPSGSPREALLALHAAVRTCLADPAVAAAATQADVGLVSSPNPASFTQFVAQERQKFRRLATAAGLVGRAE